MHWWYLFAGIVFEVMGTLCIKQASITNSYFWAGAVVILYIISFTLVGISVKKIDIGTAYAIWAGFGTVAITLLGWIVFKEFMSIQKLIAVLLIVVGTVMLKLEYA
ncbi:hypothetical protein CP960_11195 [Malaciobacter halophilus]|uniref:QacE family quaternary ammonium compound efflux SMR transporter n=1 Tax=Malaciobacter halophilus TaxID=197482 RepID=A0A2N1J0H6_9BACT|nr:multidrug efflux SMR transporter [Malaciobacter halophilus]AXH08919.1 QacE family quaternary ammonium compound efflux SMR transporter [Malaciobacter halophilus]PKI80065.1 hypothetical protein CP960_11195 [Malaciobacter halophilus]